MKKSTYMDRAMRSADPRFADILGRLGYQRTDMVSEKATDADDELAVLRAAYQDKFGKRAFHGWDSDTLREKLADE